MKKLILSFGVALLLVTPVKAVPFDTQAYRKMQVARTLEVQATSCIYRAVQTITVLQHDTKNAETFALNVCKNAWQPMLNAYDVPIELRQKLMAHWVYPILRNALGDLQPDLVANWPDDLPAELEPKETFICAPISGNPDKCLSISDMH